MGFSQASPTIYVERIIGFCRVFNHGRRRSVGELIAGANYEIFKRVVGIQIGIEKKSPLGFPLFRRPADVGRRGVIENELYLVDFAEELLRNAVYLARIMER